MDENELKNLGKVFDDFPKFYQEFYIHYIRKLLKK